MNKEEILAYIKLLLGGQEHVLSYEQIAEYSLGVPLLTESLCIDKTLTEDAAQVMSADFLNRNLPQIKYEQSPQELFSRYFSVELPQQVLDTMSQMAVSMMHIYEGLDRSIKRVDGDPSLLFVDPRSVELYNEMLRAGHGKSVVAEIEIFIPSLTPQQYQQFSEAFGAKDENGDIELAFRNGRRTKLFLGEAITRKSEIIGVTPNGVDIHLSKEVYSAHEMAQSVRTDFEKNLLPITPSGEQYKHSGWLYIHKGDHRGRIVETANFGWMTESFLQQVGIPYIVYNRTLDKQYWYNPETKKVEEFAEKEEE